MARGLFGSAALLALVFFRVCPRVSESQSEKKEKAALEPWFWFGLDAVGRAVSGSNCQNLFAFGAAMERIGCVFRALAINPSKSRKLASVQSRMIGRKPTTFSAVPPANGKA